MGMESNDRDGFNAVYCKYRNLIFQTVLMYTHNPEDAEDIVQEAFMRYYIYKSHSTVDNPKNWILVTAKNLANNHVRRLHYERELIEKEGTAKTHEVKTEADVADVFFENMWKREILEYTDKILGAVRARNKKWYDALIYAYCMEMPRQEIADCMGISVDALTGILRRAKKWIRKNYEDEYDHIIKA